MSVNIPWHLRKISFLANHDLEVASYKGIIYLSKYTLNFSFRIYTYLRSIKLVNLIRTRQIAQPSFSFSYF